MKKKLRFVHLLWLFVPLLIWWTVKDIPLKQVVEALAVLRAWKIFALLVINLAILLLFSGRWWFILKSMGHSIHYFLLTFYRIASFSVSYFTPGTQFGGEPLQVFLVQRHHGVPGPQAISSVFLDKVIEVLANFTFLVIGLVTIFLGGYSSGQFQPWLFGLALLILFLPLLHLVLLRRGVLPLKLLLGKITPGSLPWPAVSRILALSVQTETELSEYLRKNSSGVRVAVLISGLTWAAMIFEYGLMLTFLGVRLSLAQTISALTAARLAFLFPVPAGLGVLEASQVFALQMFGYPPGLGLSLALLIRARDVLVGLMGLWISGWTMKRTPMPFKYSD
ncbi:MAG: flippase-like domain-containing protein [Anaerolineae bacterium]|nr:flippase-like domain-containing protein [Anaerolineae bacterium]